MGYLYVSSCGCGDFRVAVLHYWHQRINIQKRKRHVNMYRRACAQACARVISVQYGFAGLMPGPGFGWYPGSGQVTILSPVIHPAYPAQPVTAMATSTTKTTIPHTPPHHLSNAIQLHPTHIAGREVKCGSKWYDISIFWWFYAELSRF